MAHHKKFSIDGEQNIASPDDSIPGLTATSAVEPSIYFFSIGSEATPADNTIPWYAQRHTAAGTATSVTPQNLGPATTASTATAGENHTVEPTYTAAAILFRLGLNQRSAHSIVLDPDGGITAPATANNGITFYPQHASATPLMSMTIHFTE